MRTLCIVTLVFAVLSAPALAQESEEDDSGITFSDAEEVTEEATTKLDSFDAIDRNADELLDWEEMRNQVTKRFFETDLDGDYLLNADEFVFGEPHFKLADIDQNEKVDLKELMAHAAIVFGNADQDKDDKLTRDEATRAKDREGLN